MQRSSARIVQRVTKGRRYWLFGRTIRVSCVGPKAAIADARFYARTLRIPVRIAGPDLTDILTVGGR